MDESFPRLKSCQPSSSNEPTQLIPYQVLSDDDCSCCSDEFSDWQEELAPDPVITFTTSKWNTPPALKSPLLRTRETGQEEAIPADATSKANELIPSVSSQDEINLSSATATSGAAIVNEPPLPRSTCLHQPSACCQNQSAPM